MQQEQIWIVDFGSQYTQLITRRCRELGHSSVIITVDDALARTKKNQYPKALILSGGPQSVFEDPHDYSSFFSKKGLPVLGICYGMQIIGQYFGGKVERGTQGEYGHAEVIQEATIAQVPNQFNVWMSHADHVSVVPDKFVVWLKSHNGLIAGIHSEDKLHWGIQFHPEVDHTQHGKVVLRYFIETVSKLPQDWTPGQMVELAENHIRAVGQADVLCAFSGGVDSLVCAWLAHRSLGKKLQCFFVDQGLLRPQDHAHIRTIQSNSELAIEIVDARELFLNALKGVSNPEEKRKIIGRTFIEVFEEQVHAFEKKQGRKFEYLLQGTLYPDVIESMSSHKDGGKSHKIKSHHNVGGLPERMKLKLLEPVRELFKDEVRAIGRELKIPEEWLMRHPFPGPGLGVRILGEITNERLLKVQHSDQILFEELHTWNLYQTTWQAFTVLLPVKTVGVKGDARAYEEVICLRLVNSTDGMTADFTRLPYDFLARVSQRINNEVRGITRVVYDLTSKPPGTIEWE